MSKERYLSRRQLVMALSISTIATSMAARASVSADAELIELGDQFDEIAAQIDAPSPVTWAALNRFGELYDKILVAQAQTVEGLRVKARLMCWVRLGDFDLANEAADGKQIALSIVRDLIRLYDPHLERPGALTDLVQ